MNKVKLYQSEIIRFHRFLNHMAGVLVFEGFIIGVVFFLGKSTIFLLSAWLITCFVWIYGFLRARFKLEHIGIQNMQLIGANLSEEMRDKLWSNEKMSVHGWNSICQTAGIKNGFFSFQMAPFAVITCICLSIIGLIAIGIC